ncbi:hypothetical protein MG296_14420 [Flavobacteriaceae bacterium TK19130]|nr:hypothetical protein [Thermobacterium salinum]
MNKIEPKYHFNDLELTFRKLIENTTDIRQFYYKKISDPYLNKEERKESAYNDIVELAFLILRKKRKSDTKEFKQFFCNVEEILSDADYDVKNLIVVGLFEGIQNVGGPEIDYYKSFDLWLKPKSKNEWDELIDFWEGKEWRVSDEEREKREKEVKKILNKK